MKVALDIYPIATNTKTGVGWYSLNLITNLLKYNNIEFEALLYDFLKRHNSYEKVLQFLEVARIKQQNLLPFGVYVEIWPYIKWLNVNKVLGTDADIFHFFNFIVPPNTKGKVINTVYDMVYKRYPETMDKANYRRLDKHLKRSCDGSDIIITISQNSKKEIAEFMDVNESKIRIVPPGVDVGIYNSNTFDDGIQNIKQKYNLPEKYFLYLGTLEPRKNIQSIIKAYSTNKKKFQDVKLVIAGRKGWMYKEIFELVQQEKLQDDILFPGYIEDADISYLYKGAEAFIFPSLYEGFGMPPLEAMECGTPVITSNTSSLPEVVGEAGLMVNPIDIEELSDAMVKILENSELRVNCIQKGLERAQNFTWEKSARKVIDIYHELA